MAFPNQMAYLVGAIPLDANCVQFLSLVPIIVFYCTKNPEFELRKP